MELILKIFVCVIFIQIILIRFIFKNISFQKIIINSTLLIGLFIFLFLIKFMELDFAIYFIFNFYLFMYSIFNIINMSQTSSRINLMILISKKKIKKIKHIKKFYNVDMFFENRIKRLVKLNWIKKKDKNIYVTRTYMPFFFIKLFDILRKVLLIRN
tara:strand:- start:8701 stop:9171 length:471 start_codon:yes stop_codon:yes gene_type:complete